MDTKGLVINKRLEYFSIFERKVAQFYIELRKLHTIVNDSMKHYNEKQHYVNYPEYCNILLVTYPTQHEVKLVTKYDNINPTFH